jgi:hypothetical protein
LASLTKKVILIGRFFEDGEKLTKIFQSTMFSVFYNKEKQFRLNGALIFKVFTHGI